MNRLRSLDGLRGVAALGVVVWHWYYLFPDNALQQGWTTNREPYFWLLRPLYNQGWAAVDLFFALSGFVFFWLYGEAIRSRSIDGWRFALLRIARLYPLQLATLLLVSVLQFFFLRAQGHYFIFDRNDWPHFVAQLFLVQNWWPGSISSFNGINWSVSVEVLLYVIFFLACRAGLRRGTQCLFIALLGGLLTSLDEQIARGVIGFFMGGVAFGLWEKWKDDTRATRIAQMTRVAVLAGWGFLWLSQYWHPEWFVDSLGNKIFSVLFDFLLGPLTVLSLALREHLRGPSHAAFGFLGDISYAVYLLHFPMLLMLMLLNLRLGLDPMFLMQGWVLLVFLVILIGLATMVHYRFERPMQKLLRGGFSYRRAASAA